MIEQAISAMQKFEDTPEGRVSLALRDSTESIRDLLAVCRRYPDEYLRHEKLIDQLFGEIARFDTIKRMTKVDTEK